MLIVHVFKKIPLCHSIHILIRFTHIKVYIMLWSNQVNIPYSIASLIGHTMGPQVLKSKMDVLGV